MHAQLLRELDRYDSIIWDWNGTLLDDAKLAVEAMSKILQDHGLPSLHIDRYREAFRFPVIDYYRDLGFDFDRTPFAKLADRFVEEYGNRVKQMKLFEGVAEILKTLCDAGKKQFVLSAGAQTHLEEVIHHFGIHPHFTKIYGISDHYAGSKLDRGRELLREEKIETQRAILIGDTDHDFAVARELGLDVLLIADGHQSYERLSELTDRVLRSRFFPQDSALLFHKSER